VFIAPIGTGEHAYEAKIIELAAAARDADVPVREVSVSELASLSEAVTPQGIVAVARWTEPTLPAIVSTSPRLVVICAQIRDPGNAGAVIRCADAFGADAVIMTSSSVDVTNAKVVRASTGSLFHLPVITGADLTDTVASLRDAGVRVLAADGAGAAELDTIAGLARPTAWIFGNEAWGLPAADAALADEIVRVPIHGRVESLNLATAAAVCLYATSTAQRTGC